MEDFVAWHHTKNGLYFVRSAYHAKEETKMNEKKNVSPFIMVQITYRSWRARPSRSWDTL
jgi:hypothetical protein